MNDLISRDLAMSLISESRPKAKWKVGTCILTEYFASCKDCMQDIVREMPAADAEWVKHGYWIVVGKTDKGSPILRCSVCEKERKGGGRSAYCRDCGAKMDNNRGGLDKHGLAV